MESRQKYWMFPDRFPVRKVTEVQNFSYVNKGAFAVLECGHRLRLSNHHDHSKMETGTCAECFEKTFVPEY